MIQSGYISWYSAHNTIPIIENTPTDSKMIYLYHNKKNTQKETSLYSDKKISKKMTLWFLQCLGDSLDPSLF